MLEVHKQEPAKSLRDPTWPNVVCLLGKPEVISFPEFSSIWLVLELCKHGGPKVCSFCEQIMLMNVLASGVLFLFIGPFKHVSSGETKETGRKPSLFRSSAFWQHFSVWRNFRFCARTRNLFDCDAHRRKSSEQRIIHRVAFCTKWMFRSWLWDQSFFWLFNSWRLKS